MAVVRFITPFSGITGKEYIRMSAGDIRQLCHRLIERFGPEMDILLDSDGEVSEGIVILVNRRNVHTLGGIDTPLEEDSEVLIMPHIIGG